MYFTELCTLRLIVLKISFRIFGLYYPEHTRIATKGTNQNTKHQINHYTYSDALIRQPGELGYNNNKTNNNNNNNITTSLGVCAANCRTLISESFMQ